MKKKPTAVFVTLLPVPISHKILTVLGSPRVTNSRLKSQDRTGKLAATIAFAELELNISFNKVLRVMTK
jgi:hypothetical protein